MISRNSSKNAVQEHQRVAHEKPKQQLPVLRVVQQCMWLPESETKNKMSRLISVLNVEDNYRKIVPSQPRHSKLSDTLGFKKLQQR